MFNPRSGDVGFLVDEGALGEIFWFLLQIRISPTAHIH
jgi:hypothetical protein